MVSLTILELSGMLPSLAAAFLSCLIFTTSEVMVGRNMEVRDTLKVTEVVTA